MPKFKIGEQIVYPCEEDRSWDESSWIFEKGEEFIITSVNGHTYTLDCVKCSGEKRSGISAKSYHIDPLCLRVGQRPPAGGSATYFPNLSHV